MVITTAPQSKRERRPKCSTPHMPGSVMNTLTMFVATETRKGLEIPEFLKNVVPSVDDGVSYGGRFTDEGDNSQ